MYQNNNNNNNTFLFITNSQHIITLNTRIQVWLE